MSNLLTNKFINEFGNYSNDYEYVSPTGSISPINQVSLIVGIICLIGGIILSIASIPPKIKKNSRKRKNRTTTKKVLLVFGLLSIFASFCGFGFYIYIYVAKYLPQYNKWYTSLPKEAVEELANIKYVTAMENEIRNLQSRNQQLQNNQPMMQPNQPMIQPNQPMIQPNQPVMQPANQAAPVEQFEDVNNEFE